MWEIYFKKEEEEEKLWWFANKGPSSQSYGFSSSHVWTWELDYKESWAPKNWCFWTMCWRRLLRVPWTTRRSNQSIVKEISPKCSLEGLMLKLKLQYSWCEELTHWKRPWCWERLKAGGEGGDRGWDGWMASLTRWTWVWVDSGSWWWTGRPGVLQSVGSQSVGHDWPSGRQHIRCGKIFPAYSSSNRVSSLLLSTGLHTFSYKVQEQKPVDYTKRSAVREALHP